ncbi:hypothetical protein NUW54_g3797 [Trametes sanguinea]|uniref:Uncharacterized protein n=1 Tax=Trametes sanguinea TaxID=158606 RepID=A0ACC1Q1V6_9APHY|nr:hypothetical protein NUW54_g3797 [Trametes sanguinea]
MTWQAGPGATPPSSPLRHPPPTEVELRAERLKKELRWTADEEGWSIIRPDKDVEWDERFRNKLRVYIDPAPSEKREDTNSSAS